jgi:hypothetical protein
VKTDGYLDSPTSASPGALKAVITASTGEPESMDDPVKIDVDPEKALRVLLRSTKPEKK